MGAGHGGAEHHHSHGGSGGLGWTLLDTIMTAVAIGTLVLLIDLLIQDRRQRVRYNLTPQGQAAAGGPLVVDRDALAAELDRLDQDDAAKRAKTPS